MLKRIVEKVTAVIIAPGNDAQAAATDRDEALQLTTAVLMVDVARADHTFDDVEMQRILSLIESHFDVDADAAAELFASADEQADDLVGLHEFTQLLHENLSETEKARIVSLLWQVAYADGSLDKYENSLVLKISDLLYVSRGRVMRLKHDAEVASR